jgi:hypothetical protein
MLYGFAEYHLERRMRSFTLLARQADRSPTLVLEGAADPRLDLVP